MAMVVKNNMSAVRTLNTLNQNSSALQKSLAKVSSGMKINSAQDDASGYAISERMRVQIRSLDQANQNTQNASSLMKTAEGAVSSTLDILKTLKEKAINAATDTNTDSDRATIQKELDQYIDQIDDNALTTFNGKYLVDGSKSQYGKDTYTKMTNQSLQKGTDGETLLTALKNRNDEDLEIKNTDYVTASYVKNGETNTVKFKVGGNKLQDIFVALDGAINGDNPGEANAQGAGNVFAATKNVKMTDPDGTAGAAETDDPVTGQNSGLTADKLAVIAGLTDEDSVVTAVAEGKITTDDIKAVTDKATEIAKNVDVDEAGSAAETLMNAVSTNFKNTNVSTADDTKTVEERDGLDTTAKDALNVKLSDGSTLTTLADNTANVSITVASGSYNQPSVTAAAKEVVDHALDEAGGATTLADATTAIEKYAKDVSLVDVNANAGNITSVGTTANATDEMAALATAVLENSALTAAQAAMNGTDADAINSKVAEKAAELAKKPKEALQDKIVMNDTFVGVSSAGDNVYTNDGTEGLTISSAKTEIKNQISGLTISITDSEGNVKKSANAALDAFKTTIYAKNASAANEMSFQVGGSANQAIAVGLDDMRSEALGLKGSEGSKVSVATQDKANAAVSVFDNAIQKVLDQQATIGAIESRLEYTSQNLTTSSENVQAAESTIRDADMAKEMTTYTKNNVLLQAAQSMLAQANQNSSAVLSLLQ